MMTELSCLKKVLTLEKSIGGVVLYYRVLRGILFKELRLSDNSEITWISKDKKVTICDSCWGRKESCELYRVDGEFFWCCSKCQKVFRLPVIGETTEKEVVKFVKVLDVLSKNCSQLIPENPTITEKVIEYAFLVNGKDLTKQFSNNAKQIHSLFRLVRSGQASIGQREKAVAFSLSLCNMFGYEAVKKGSQELSESL